MTYDKERRMTVCADLMQTSDVEVEFALLNGISLPETGVRFALWHSDCSNNVCVVERHF